MSIKIALCDDLQIKMKKMQSLIQTHPQAALFEVSCFLKADELLNQSTVYDVLFTEIEKISGDINGFELASQMNEHTKIIILSAYSPNYISMMMRDYSFELFESIDIRDINNILQGLDHYLAWREDSKSYLPMIPRRTPSFRPSIALKMTRKKDVIVYYDEILYLYQVPSFSSEIIITTIRGEYKLRARMKDLKQLRKLPQFNSGNDGLYLVNLDYCIFDSIERKLTLRVNGRTIKTFSLSTYEYRMVKHYSSQ